MEEVFQVGTKFFANYRDADDYARDNLPITQRVVKQIVVETEYKRVFNPEDKTTWPVPKSFYVNPSYVQAWQEGFEKALYMADYYNVHGEWPKNDD